jgi:hypothetical protein
VAAGAPPAREICTKSRMYTHASESTSEAANGRGSLAHGTSEERPGQRELLQDGGGAPSVLQGRSRRLHRRRRSRSLLQRGAEAGWGNRVWAPAGERGRGRWLGEGGVAAGWGQGAWPLAGGRGRSRRRGERVMAAGGGNGRGRRRGERVVAAADEGTGSPSGEGVGESMWSWRR